MRTSGLLLWRWRSVLWAGSAIFVFVAATGSAKNLRKCSTLKVNKKDCEVRLAPTSLQPDPDAVIVRGGVKVQWRSPSGDSFLVDLTTCRDAFPTGSSSSYSPNDPPMPTSDALVFCEYSISPKGKGPKVDPHIIVVSGSRGDSNAKP